MVIRRVCAILALLVCPLTGHAESQPVIQAGTSGKYLANSSSPGLGISWTGESFDDSAWSAGSYGIGYETGSGAVNLLQTTVPVTTRSVYTRSTFNISDISSINQVTLGVDYDDGYIAWINGVEVYRSASMPSGAPAWDMNPALHESSNAVNPDYTPVRDISTAALPVLQNGTNVLAIGVWNSIGSSGSSSDLVLVPQLSIDASPGGGAGSVLLEDDFNDGDMSGWSVLDNCGKGTSTWAVVNSELMQTGACRAYTPEGIAIGTTLLHDLTLPSDIDIRLRLRSEDPDVDAVASNDGDTHKYGAIAVEFGYQDSSNFYRFEISGIKGHRKLLRNQGGTFTELNTSPQSYVRGQWVTLRILRQNGLIIVFVDDQQIMAAADNAFASGQLALFCARNVSCSFDNVVVLGAPPDPVIGLGLPDGLSPAHSSSEYFVASDAGVDIEAFTTQAASTGGVEFVVNEGTVDEVSQVDLVPPYNAQFMLPAGDHTITGHLLDIDESRMTAPEATAVLPKIGVEGIHLVSIGDSITAGLGDDLPVDDYSADGRNTGGGYAPVLNNYLVAGNGVPVTVINDGIPGDETLVAAGKIGLILYRTPEAGAYLATFGTNDSGGTMPLMSGLGLNPGESGYAGSYKDYMQQIIDAVTGAGKLIYLGKIPAHLKRASQDAIIQTYNQVIDELMAQLRADYPSAYLTFEPPDFHDHFTSNSQEIGPDLVHPNGAGYQSMGRLWCEALNGQQGLSCLDDDRDGLLNSVELLNGTNPENVDTDGDGLVDGDDGMVPVGSIVGGIDTDGDGYIDGELEFGTDALAADSDGDRLNDGLEVANGADPLDAANWPSLADGDIAPLGAPDGDINAGDLLVGMRLVLGLETASPLELAHGDLYPPGAPDGLFNIQDLILLQQLP